MKRTSALAAAALVAGALTLHAQDGTAVAANMRASWTNIRDLLGKMADKMPDENYRFKPTPEMEDFGQRMAHVLSFNMRGCATAQGEQKTVNVSERGTPTKAEILGAIKEVNAECDAAFNALATDADAMKMVTAGRGGQRPKQVVLQGTVLEHSQEVYGYLAVYLRLKGIVPPSSDRNESLTR
jgi:hypothetical protein